MGFEVIITQTNGGAPRYAFFRGGAHITYRTAPHKRAFNAGPVGSAASTASSLPGDARPRASQRFGYSTMSSHAIHPHPGGSTSERLPFWWFWAILIAGTAWTEDSRAAATPSPSAPLAANPFERSRPAQPQNAIDHAVFARLGQLGIDPALPCTDVVFVRRVFLDVIGTLPTPAETRQFLQDRRSDKRTALIDQLLGRDEFADYWTMKWSDLLRVKAEFPINLWPNAAQAYHRWIHTAMRDNLPYDQFARTLLTANGSNFRAGPVNFYRAMQARDPDAIGRTVALTFMGVRAEKWPARQREQMAVFFSRIGYKGTAEWKEEIVFFNPEQPLKAAEGRGVLPDGTAGTLAPERDPREAFADWLITPHNPWFTRAIANRAWSWFFGRGVVHEPDDLRPDNPPANPELLTVLAQELVAARYDLKRLFRAILTSATYQLSSIARSDLPAAEANFAFYPLRRLNAEVLIDALNQISGTTEKYTSAIPEPFTVLPEDQRSIALPDGSISSSFLETFGRPGRDTGLEAERNNRVTASQRLHLLNSTHVRRKIEQGPKIQALLRSRGGAGEVIDGLYYTILSRPPTDQERQVVVDHTKTAGMDARTAAQDLAWALVNSAEFLYHH